MAIIIRIALSSDYTTRILCGICLVKSNVYVLVIIY